MADTERVTLIRTVDDGEVSSEWTQVRNPFVIQSARESHLYEVASFIAESSHTSLLRGLAEDLTARADEQDESVIIRRGYAEGLRQAASLLRDRVGQATGGLSGAAFDQIDQGPTGNRPAESDPQIPEDTERCTCDERWERVELDLKADPSCPIHGSVPKRCPTCGSDDPAVCCWKPGEDHRSGEPHPFGNRVNSEFCCPDPFHSGSVQQGQGEGQ